MFIVFLIWLCIVVFLFKQKTAYERRISDWSPDVGSSDLRGEGARGIEAVDRDRLFGAGAHLVGVGPALVRHQEARQAVEGSGLVLRQPTPFDQRVADRITRRGRRGRHRGEAHLDAIPGYLFGGGFAGVGHSGKEKSDSEGRAGHPGGTEESGERKEGARQ